MDGHIVWALQVLSDCTIEFIHGNRVFSIPTLPYNPTLYTAYTRMSIRMYVRSMYVCMWAILHSVYTVTTLVERIHQIRWLKVELSNGGWITSTAAI